MIFAALVLMLLFGGEQKGKETVHLEKATVGAGCFWCVEAVFQRIDGVKSVVPGYAGGTKENPTYKEVCTGTTGHAEVAQITYDPAKVSYEKILKIFWVAHDPTTLNRQGNDAGTQYRSVVFYHDEKQRAIAEQSKKDAQKDFDNPIVTEIQPLAKFYEAEDYHHNYYNENKFQPYCQFVIKPKLKKLNLEK